MTKKYLHKKNLALAFLFVFFNFYVSNICSQAFQQSILSGCRCLTILRSGGVSGDRLLEVNNLTTLDSRGCEILLVGRRRLIRTGTAGKRESPEPRLIVGDLDDVAINKRLENVGAILVSSPHVESANCVMNVGTLVNLLAGLEDRNKVNTLNKSPSAKILDEPSLDTPVVDVVKHTWDADADSDLVRLLGGLRHNKLSLGSHDVVSVNR